MTTPRARPGVPTAINYRGRRVPVVLGACFTGILVAALGAVLAVWSIGDGRPRPDHPPLAWVLVGIVIVFAAGWYDDTRPGRTRGLVDQLARAARGTITPGLVKLIAIGAASGFVSWMLGARGLRLVLSTAVLAGCANLWNLLDVRPGRALKFFLPTELAIPLAGAHPAYAVAIAAVAIPTGVLVLVLDLRERGMLGDSGSNVLGFVVGWGSSEPCRWPAWPWSSPRWWRCTWSPRPSLCPG
jgi:UDP-GlcNAc:undecaprenyl-phosphate GlcNAc-1-phosphate transferase